MTESRFLEAPLVRQADGELRNKNDIRPENSLKAQLPKNSVQNPF